MSDDISYMDSIPVELFRIIFTYFTAKDLVKCRIISHRWKEIIDEIIIGEHFWEKKCESEFASIIQIARYKSRPSMKWSDLYRSLSLWSKLEDADEEQDEVCPASSVAEEIKSFTILRNGVIGVHKRASIAYYDIENFTAIIRSSIVGEYMRYSENEEVITILSCHLQLYILKKLYDHPQLSETVIIDDVKIFILLPHCVYYVDMQDDLYVIMFKDMQSDSNLVIHCYEGVLAMGYKDEQLQVLTFQRKVYTLVENKFVFSELLGPTSNLLHQLHEYNLLETLDWRIYFQWMFVLNHNIPQGPLQDIITTRTYGDIVFVGSTWGVLRIYYQPFTLGEFDLFRAQPIKQYNFMQRRDCPVLSMCPILNIDVLEIENGHKVIIAMPKKIAVLKFTHNYLNMLSPAFSIPDDPESPELAEPAEKNDITV